MTYRRLWLAALAALLAFAVWWRLSALDDRLVPTRDAIRSAPIAPPPPDEPVPSVPQPAAVLDALGIDRAVTPYCAQIWIWAAQRVPGWVITDNIEAQAMLFDAPELACLTGTPKPRPEWIPPLPGGILEMAEARPNHRPREP